MTSLLVSGLRRVIKSYDHTCNNTLARRRNVIDNVLVKMRFLLEILSILKAIISSFKGHIINRILHSWSFHMKFMKLAENSFHKFLMK